MNYFITHCDEKYLKYAERLFESLKTYSSNKIIFFTVGFDYESKFDNVISIKFNLDDYFSNISHGELNKDFFVFLKPLIVDVLLSNDIHASYKDSLFCYLDVDCLANEKCDNVFAQKDILTNYPLLNLGCQQFMMKDGRGNPFSDDGKINLELTLEAPLLKKLGYDINSRTLNYLQTGVFLFNSECSVFIKKWKDLCFSDLITKDWRFLAPYHEETAINCLLWQIKDVKNLDRAIINVPESLGEAEVMFDKLKNPLEGLQRISAFCTIPAKKNMKNLCFLHGKFSEEVYNLIVSKTKKLYLKIHSTSLGDTLAATPLLRKLNKAYKTRINVVTHIKDIFINNQYIDNLYSFEEFDNLKTPKDKEVFETFLLNQKSSLGIEKKHNTIDIRQFHALDLGFTLLEGEMHYDYVANEYEGIEGLPERYICLHTCETWPSRTYSKENWQELINRFEEEGLPIVLLGKNSKEVGFHIVEKQTQDLKVKKGIDLTNKLSLSQCWPVINKSKAVITMDSGLLHLAGTTDTHIVQLGSSIHPKLRAPYREGSQDYKYEYIKGPCDLFCGSDVSYGIKEWGTVNSVPPIINCLENKPKFECHPSPQKVFDFVINEIVEKDNVFNYVTFSYENDRLALNYSLSSSKYIGKYNIAIEEESSGIVMYQELVNISHAEVDFWTDFTFAKSKMNENFKVKISRNNSCVFEKSFSYPHFNPSSPLLELSNKLQNFNLSGVSLGVLSEVFIDNNYDKGLVKVLKDNVVVDIGFNVGLFSVKSFLEGAKKIYAVEPNEENISKFKSIDKNNVINNLHISNIAISDHDGTDSFLIDEDYDNSGRSMLEKTLHSGRTSFNSHSCKTVKTQKFETFLKENNIDKIDLLKIDCEGGELFILHEDNRKIFEDKVNKVVGEIHFSLDTEQGSYMKNFLEETGFEFSIDAGPDPAGLITFSAAKKKIKKIVFLAPHLSTGGSPQYLKWLIEKYKSQNYKTFVVEYCYYGDYVVQRNEIIKLVGKDNFYSYATLRDSDEHYREKSKDLINLIRQINPDYIHLNEIAEQFSLKSLTEELKNFLYNQKRKFKVFETNHDTSFDYKTKVLKPDEFHFCSTYHLSISKHLDIPKKIVEMEIINKKRPNRIEKLKSLGLDPEKYHVLQVGLFHNNKNQKFTFDLAKKFIHEPVEFHFVGNTCFINNCGIDKEQKNCKVWGERDDVDSFMSCMDLFVMPSKNELNPISIKEALSWSMPCFVSKLDALQLKYSENKNIKFIEGDNLFNYIKEQKQIYSMDSKFSVLDSNNFEVTQEKDFVKLEILGKEICDYDVEFICVDTLETLYKTKISNNMWTSCNSSQKRLKIRIYNCITSKVKIFWPESMNIINESGSLGDVLAWLPVVDEFTKIKNQKVNFFTPRSNLFDKNKYPNINFKPYIEKEKISRVFDIKKIGCFDKKSLAVPLQDLACDVLGIPKLNKSIKPFLNKSFIKERPFEKKYICIATHSTSQLKYWNNEKGWDQTIEYLKKLGYEVICVDRDHYFGNTEKKNSIPENCIHYAGESLSDIVNCLHHCEFFIGLSSGLSWLAWACCKPVIMICGFLEANYHFDSAYYIQNKNVCNCCWNKGHEFDSSNWMWCPENKNFECSTEIPFEKVQKAIDNLIENDLS